MPCDYYKLPHPGIQSLKPYIPGKSIEELAREQGLSDIIKLASNENPLGCSPLVKQALADLSEMHIASYPSPANHPVLGKLSEKLAINENRITFGDGSDLLFFFLLTTFALHSGKHILTHEYAFISYRIQAQTLGIPVSITNLKPNWQVDIDAMIEACSEKTAMIFIANPNNPTGLEISYPEIRRLLTHIPASTILVLDEAYHEYAYQPGDRTSLNLLEEYPNLVLTRTFSKAYGLAGLRLGYALASPEITNLLQRVQPPFAVNQAALTAAYAALDDEDFIIQTIELNSKGMQQMIRGLDVIKARHLPSRCNFVTIDCKRDANLIYQCLLKQGIIVRPLHPYDLPTYIRVSISHPLHNDRFLDTLALCLSELEGV